MDDAIIKAIFEVHALTTRQVVKYRYSSSSINYARERLSRLTRAGYLTTFPAPRRSLSGKSQLIYQLSGRALRYLAAQGVDTAHRMRLAGSAPRGDQFTLHSLAITEVLLAARQLTSRRSDIRLASMRHERDLKRTAVQRIGTGATSAKAEDTFCVPDSWIEFHLQAASGKAAQRPIWLELDRGSEGVKKVKQKVRNILRYVERGHYERVFGTRRIRVAVAVDGSAFADLQRADKRVKDVVRWIEEELSALGKRSWGSVFAVAPVEQPDQLDAERFFLDPVWSVPHRRSPISLLDLPEHGLPSWGQRDEQARTGTPCHRLALSRQWRRRYQHAATC